VCRGNALWEIGITLTVLGVEDTEGCPPPPLLKFSLNE